MASDERRPDGARFETRDALRTRAESAERERDLLRRIVLMNNGGWDFTLAGWRLYDEWRDKYAAEAERAVEQETSE